MKLAHEPEGCVNAVPLVNAVYCADCETITDSPHDGCSVCGSHSVVNLFKIMGGALRSARGPVPARVGKFNFNLTADVRGLPADTLNEAVRLVTRLADASAEVRCLHMNVEPVAVVSSRAA